MRLLYNFTKHYSAVLLSYCGTWHPLLHQLFHEKYGEFYQARGTIVKGMWPEILHQGTSLYERFFAEYIMVCAASTPFL